MKQWTDEQRAAAADRVAIQFTQGSSVTSYGCSTGEHVIEALHKGSHLPLPARYILDLQCELTEAVEIMDEAIRDMELNRALIGPTLSRMRMYIERNSTTSAQKGK